MKKTTRYFHSILLLSTLFVSSAPLYGQKDFKHDTAYYETYPEKINFRIYLSQKYIHSIWDWPCIQVRFLKQ